MNKRKVLLAPTGFKECCSSLEITSLLYKYLEVNDLILYKLPISDGGDGFLDSIQSNNKLQSVRYYNIKTSNEELINIPVVINEDNLYIESADVVGLKLVNKDKRNPLKLNTFALGSLLRKIESDNSKKIIDIKKVIIGIGGTATNDFGFGVISAFGLKIFDNNGDELPVYPSEYLKIGAIKWEQVQLSFEIEPVIDVNSPLTGEYGSASIFAPQKGASLKEIDILERGFLNIINILKRQGMSFELSKLSGAGGGLAAGLKLFMGARIKNSEDFILNDLNAAEYIGKVDYVITGEGRFDSQSYLDKAAGVIIKNFRESIVFIICGVFEGEKSELPENVKIIELIKYFNSEEESVVSISEGIKFASAEILQQIAQSK